MKSARQRFVLRLYLYGMAIALVLTVVVTLLLARSDGGNAARAVLEGCLIFLAVALALVWLVVRQLLEHVLKPAGRAANIAARVAQGDLSLGE